MDANRQKHISFPISTARDARRWKAREREGGKKCERNIVTG